MGTYSNNWEKNTCTVHKYARRVAVLLQQQHCGRVVCAVVVSHSHTALVKVYVYPFHHGRSIRTLYTIERFGSTDDVWSMISIMLYLRSIVLAVQTYVTVCGWPAMDGWMAWMIFWVAPVDCRPASPACKAKSLVLYCTVHHKCARGPTNMHAVA